MNAYCTTCGTALNPTLRFCTSCGAMRDADSAGAAVESKPRVNRRWLWWGAALIVAFLVGLFLGRTSAPKPPHCPIAADGGGKGGAGDSDAIPGAGTGKKHDADGNDDAPPASIGDIGKYEGAAQRIAAGAALSADTLDQSGGDVVSGKELTARDFRYDKTNLPRYAEEVKLVVSSISYSNPTRTDIYGTSAGIVTGSSFDSVVAWYRQHLPAGWRDTTVGDMGRLGAQLQQLSPDNIMKMIVSESSPAPAKPIGSTPATAASERIQISIFKPPAGSASDSGIMIVQHGNEPVLAMMQAHVRPETRIKIDK